jgi:hypothetical protein
LKKLLLSSLCCILFFSLFFPVVSADTHYVCYTVQDFHELLLYSLSDENQYMRTLENGVSFYQENGTGALRGVNLEFSCGLCEEADLGDTVTVLNAPGDSEAWCDYDPPVMEGMVEDNEVICMRSAFSGRRWDIEFLSWNSQSGCYDGESGQCDYSDGWSSFYEQLDTAGCDFETIQEAIDNAEAGDIIQVWPGTYTESLVIDKPLTIRGSGADLTIIDPQFGPAITIAAGGPSLAAPLLISGFTLTGTETFGQEAHRAPALDIRLEEGGDHVILLDSLSIAENEGWGLSMRAADPDSELILFVEDSTLSENGVGMGIAEDDGSHDGYSSNFSSELTLVDLILSDNEGAGLFFADSVEKLLLSETLVSNNGGNGLFLVGGAETIIEESVFSDNSFLSSSSPYWQSGNAGLRVSCTDEAICGKVIVTQSSFHRNGLVEGEEQGSAVLITAEQPADIVLLSNTLNASGDDAIRIIGDTSAAVYLSSFPNTLGDAISTDPEDFVLPRATVDARQNYWGHLSGPSGILPGDGLPITEGITASTWYMSNSFDTLLSAGMAYTYHWLSFDSIKWENEAADEVRSDLALIRYGNDTAGISWNSSHPEIISPTGRVIPGEESVEVTLTASISQFLHDPVTKEIVVTVPKQLYTDEEAVSLVLDTIDFEMIALENEDQQWVTDDLTLATTGPYRTTISWASDNPDVTPEGVVILTNQSKNVTLTATVSRGDVSQETQLDITVGETNDPLLLRLMDAKRALSQTLVMNGNPSPVRAGIYTPRRLDAHDVTISWSASPALVDFSYDTLIVEDGVSLGSGSLLLGEETLSGSDLSFDWAFCEEATSFQDSLGPSGSLSALLNQQLPICAEDSAYAHYDLYVATVGDGLDCDGNASLCDETGNLSSLHWRSSSDSVRPVSRMRTQQEVLLTATLEKDGESITRRFPFTTAMAEAPAVVIEPTGLTVSEVIEQIVAPGLSRIGVFELTPEGEVIGGENAETIEVIPMLTEEDLENFSFKDHIEGVTLYDELVEANGSLLVLPIVVLPMGQMVMLDNSTDTIIIDGDVRSDVYTSELLLTPSVLAAAKYIKMPSDEGEVFLNFDAVVAGRVAAGNVILALPSGHYVDLVNTTLDGGRTWNGLFLGPRLLSTAGLTVNGNPVDIVLEVGGQDRSFSLSEPVAIILRGHGNSRAAWSPDDGALIPVEECGADFTPPCSYAVGNDMAILTDHLSRFAAYSVDSTPQGVEQSRPETGGGGGESEEEEVLLSAEEEEVVIPARRTARDRPASEEAPLFIPRLTLFDLALTLTDNILFFGERLLAVFTLINVGDPGKVDANLKYTITNELGEAVYLDTEVVSIETQRDVLRTFDVSDYPPGEYVLRVVLTYEGQKDPAVSERSFSIVEQSVVNWSNAVIIALGAAIAIFTYVQTSWRRDEEEDEKKEKKEPSSSAPQSIPVPGGAALLDRAQEAVDAIGPFSLVVAGEHAFNLADGRQLHSLGELRESLLSMERSLFFQHVNAERNDFADWVESIFEAPDLARKMRLLHSREALAELLRVASASPTAESSQRLPSS